LGPLIGPASSLSPSRWLGREHHHLLAPLTGHHREALAGS
jgi:hypothetical protein